VAGIKDSQNDMDFARSLAIAARKREAPLRILLGTRSLIDAAVLVGGHGAVPGIANVVPQPCVQAFEAAARGDFAAAAEAQERVHEAIRLAQIAKGSMHSASMGGMKAALKAMGVIAHATVAPPLRTPTDEEQAQIAEAARALGLRIAVPA
jgi:4-hydroxy-tetrahydrodipicolinate synthase